MVAQRLQVADRLGVLQVAEAVARLRDLGVLVSVVQQLDEQAVLRPALVELPGGWSGGSQPTADGAVFAVAKQGTAVVITTNQRQTVGARRIAEQVIATLGL